MLMLGDRNVSWNRERATGSKSGLAKGQGNGGRDGGRDGGRRNGGRRNTVVAGFCEVQQKTIR